MKSIHAVRTLALDPTTPGFAFAALEGSGHLVDWGLVHMATQDDAAYRSRMEKLLDRVNPQILVVEDMSESRRGGRAPRRADIAEECARARGMKAKRISRADVKRMFAASGTTKWEIASAVSRLFPELSPSLPKKRRIWETEDRRMAIFSAASFALTFLRTRGVEWR